MLSVDDLSHGVNDTPRSASTAIFWIVIMNLVFSFDSILGAKALTDVFLLMAVAIVIGGLLMLVLADHVVEFLKKNRVYEVLGLFILFIVGIMLVSEGAHKAHVTFFGHEVHAMTKPTFYFVLTVLVLVDVVQGRYQKKLIAMHHKQVVDHA
jgi:predicted tellurium resistance membrane protein TerC